MSAARGSHSAVTVGNFDGVHLGHQALLYRCRELAEDTGETAVITFEPLPQALFRPEAAPARLSTIYQKLDLLRGLGVNTTWLMRFDRALADLSPEVFATEALAKGLAARWVVVGADFRFGRRREGNVETLRALGRDLGFEAVIVPPVQVGPQRVSSTLVRQALAAGEFAQAEACLGRPYRMEGRVVPGQRLGRRLGYPTANLRIRAQPCPLGGIFAVFARTPRGAWLPAVSSLGRRPTVGAGEPLLEVHIFDFDQPLYGQRLEVQFVAKLRDEARFENVQELVAQMRRDEAEARAILSDRRKPQA